MFGGEERQGFLGSFSSDPLDGPESPVPVFAAGVTVPLESHIGDPLQNVWF